MYFTYIVSNKEKGVFYTGVTSNLKQRIWAHRNEVSDSFSAKYHLHKLVYYEAYESIESAIKREKTLKKWKRAWKVALIEEKNPNWEDLYEQIEV